MTLASSAPSFRPKPSRFSRLLCKAQENTCHDRSHCDLAHVICWANHGSKHVSCDMLNPFGNLGGVGDPHFVNSQTPTKCFDQKSVFTKSQIYFLSSRPVFLKIPRKFSAKPQIYFLSSRPAFLKIPTKKSQIYFPSSRPVFLKIPKEMTLQNHKSTS